MVRTASCRLYEALSRACIAHGEHLVKLCLEATCEGYGVEIGCSQICFRLAYAPASVVTTISSPKSSPSLEGNEKERHSVKSSIIDSSEVPCTSASKWCTEAKWFKVESVMGCRKDANTAQNK